MPLVFTVPPPPGAAASAAPAAAGCPAWLRPALRPDVTTIPHEWQAALDGLQLYFIGDPVTSYETEISTSRQINY